MPLAAEVSNLISVFFVPCGVMHAITCVSDRPSLNRTFLN
jgi:hypothetical protein